MGISAISGLSGYSILGIYGNPNSVRSISKVTEQSQKNNPLVTVAEEKEQLDRQDAIKDFGELDPVKSMSTGGFADILSMQEASAESQQSSSKISGNAADALNDTIGLMGFQNNLREKLTGSEFQPFAIA